MGTWIIRWKWGNWRGEFVAWGASKEDALLDWHTTLLLPGVPPHRAVITSMTFVPLGRN